MRCQERGHVPTLTVQKNEKRLQTKGTNERKEEKEQTNEKNK